MTTVLASTLSSKPVMGSDGKELGTVHNITMNVTTGELESVLVTPKDDDVYRFETTDDGNLRIPAHQVQGVDDYLMVE
ncbi:photosystem reaction center subunit H [Salinadaptatus halalkaliphilus]|uniref:Photosystem reaction center subunit H n=1 Tax=Salinadaptatus halalkaliphilus TaxID=2419781 RepID=A0A4S3TG66_9EURY|nr:PRC-barrel domain-containing protein [Salinadaptatus halalkaliphilus]THE62919.1 photosystem reaction center subunit H [Salinadaptatus halalkaliphilus]